MQKQTEINTDLLTSPWLSHDTKNRKEFYPKKKGMAMVEEWGYTGDSTPQCQAHQLQQPQKHHLLSKKRWQGMRNLLRIISCLEIVVAEHGELQRHEWRQTEYHLPKQQREAEYQEWVVSESMYTGGRWISKCWVVICRWILACGSKQSKKWCLGLLCSWFLVYYRLNGQGRQKLEISTGAVARS